MPYQKKFKDTLYNKEWLRRVYVEEDRNAAQVGALIGCDKSAVLTWLRKFEIPVKDASAAQKLASHPGSHAPRPRAHFKETLHNPEWVRARAHLNASELAREADCSVPSAQNAMVQANIPVPNISEAMAGRERPLKRKAPGEKVTRATSSRRASAICRPGPCVICGVVSDQINHIDFNWQNNDPSNLERLCATCHATQQKAERAEMRKWLAELGIGYRQVWKRARTAILKGEYGPSYQKQGPLKIDGVSQSLERWSVGSGISSQTIRRRLERGWEPKKAVTEPVIPYAAVEFEGRRDTVTRHAQRKGLDPGNVYSRLRNGWTLERALNTPIRPSNINYDHEE